VPEGKAQKQLVMIRNDQVVARYFEGEEFRCKLKNGRKLEGRIKKMAEFYIVTTEDSILLQSIHSVDSRGYWRTNVMRDVGYILLYGGIGYCAVDLINQALGSDGVTFDQNDRNALVIAGIGAAMLHIKPKYRRVKDGMVLRVVMYNSSYYYQERIKY
jgi:hypothetical protein